MSRPHWHQSAPLFNASSFKSNPVVSKAPLLLAVYFQGLTRGFWILKAIPVFVFHWKYMTFLAKHVSAQQPILGPMSSASIPMSFHGIDLEVVLSSCSSSSASSVGFSSVAYPNVPSMSSFRAFSCKSQTEQTIDIKNYMEFPEFHSPIAQHN